jgi:hypothetical protein
VDVRNKCKPVINLYLSIKEEEEEEEEEELK